MLLQLRDRISEVNSPMDLDYMRRVRFRLRLLDSWPNKELKQPYNILPIRHHKFLCALWFSTLIMQVCIFFFLV